MKTRIIFILFAFITSICLGQKKEKIKGDKEVISVTNAIDYEFNMVEVNDNLKVTIAQSNRNSYVLTTDKNLADAVKFDVTNGVLKIHTSSKITSSKKLEVFLSVIGIVELVVNDDAEVESQGKLTADIFSLKGNDSSKFDLDIEAENTNVILMDNSDGKIDLKGKEISVNMGDRSDLKGKIDGDNLTADLSKNAQFDVDGKVDSAIFNLKNSADLKGKKFKTATASLSSSNNTDIYIHATKNLVIDAQGKSKVYVYGNPNIDVQGLTDKSRIIKK